MEKFISDIEYLAIPYSDDDNDVMDFRAELSDIVCADLMNQGRLVYAPISACHHIAKKYGLPRDWKFWKYMDEEFVRICKKMSIITLDGWEVSTGVQAEIALAEKDGIPIEYIDPAPYLEKMELETE